VKTAPMEWKTNGVTHVKVAATDTEAIKKLKSKGAKLEATYFNNKGTKTFQQFQYPTPKQEE